MFLYTNTLFPTNSSVKIGLSEQKPEQILANLKSALPHIVKAIKGEWDNVQSLSIKTSSSVSLPIWSCNLGSEEGGRWDGLTVKDDVEIELSPLITYSGEGLATLKGQTFTKSGYAETLKDLELLA